MNIFRNRRGELIFVIAIVCLGLVELGSRWIFHDDDYYLRERWPIPLGFLLAAAVVRMLTQQKPLGGEIHRQQWIISSSSDPTPARINPNVSTEKWKLFRERDTYWGLPVRFWPWVLCGLGVISYFLPRSALK